MNTGELIVWLLLAVGYSLFLSILYLIYNNLIKQKITKEK